MTCSQTDARPRRHELLPRPVNSDSARTNDGWPIFIRSSSPANQTNNGHGVLMWAPINAVKQHSERNKHIHLFPHDPGSFLFRFLTADNDKYANVTFYQCD